MVSFYLNVWFSVDLSNIMHHKSQSRLYWFTSSTGLNINTNLLKKSSSALIQLHFSFPALGKLLPSAD